VALIWLLEIGGMTKAGREESGTCIFHTVQSCAVTSTATAGKWTAFTTDDFGIPFMPYVELHACSAFSFLRGGSFPEQLALTAAELEMPALALVDRDGVYGAQRFSVAAREHGVRPIIGCELTMEDGAVLPVLVESRNGYKNLCQLLTQAHLRSEKGKCATQWSELPEFAEGLVALCGLHNDLGSARVSRAGFGVTPKRSLVMYSAQERNAALAL
jgi:error-prone DNA polymerase